MGNNTYSSIPAVIPAIRTPRRLHGQPEHDDLTGGRLRTVREAVRLSPSRLRPIRRPPATNASSTRHPGPDLRAKSVALLRTYNRRSPRKWLDLASGSVAVPCIRIRPIHIRYA